MPINSKNELKNIERRKQEKRKKRRAKLLDDGKNKKLK